MTSASRDSAYLADPEADIPTLLRLAQGTETGTLPRDLIVAGPAGTGKTFGILTWLHLLAADYPNLRILVCRQTRASLTDSVLVTFEQEILPADGLARIASGVQRRVRQAYRYPNGSEIVLGGLDTPAKILSTAWDIVYVNEAIEATEDAWETLFSRLNRPGRVSALGYLVGDTNPGHPDHWLKRRADSGRTAYWHTSHKANPALWSGEKGGWTDAALAYLAQLDSLSGTRRARLRDGLWAVGEGLWFDSFDPDVHAVESAEFDPALDYYLAVDPGVWTGAVLFQVRQERRERPDGKPERAAFVNAFGDYLAVDRTARDNAAALLALCESRTGRRPAASYCDPAGGARNPIGPTVMAEYAAAGLPLRPWAAANPSVGDSLDFVSSLLSSPSGAPGLTIHPRCSGLRNAFLSYRRAKRAEQWMDYPEDPQHPAEDLIDALRGGLHARLRGPVLRIGTVGEG